MTDRHLPVEPATAATTLPGASLMVRVPVLRRPPGWGVLDEPALRVRATQLYLACMQQVHPLVGLRDAAGSTVHGLPGSWQEAAAPAHQEAPSPGPGTGTGPGTGLAAPTRLAAPMACVTPIPPVSPPAALAAQAAAAAEPHAAPASGKGSHWHLLPWGLLLGGAMLLAPWLIWAPLVGGLCLGLLLLQTGMLRRWLQSRELDDGAAVTAPGVGADGVVMSSALAGDEGIQAVQGVGPRRLRWAHSGWMLSATLALVGVQAAMLITTVQIKNREPAALAGAIRAAHPGRATRQGTPPGAPELGTQELGTQERSQPLPTRGAAALEGQPDVGTTPPAGPRRGGAP